VLRPALISTVLVLSLTAASCSGGTSSANSGSFKGVEGSVAATINQFQSDASSTNGADMCANVLDTALLAKIKRAGNCTTVINAQLKTVDDFTVTIKSIKVTGTTATARVQTVNNGNKVFNTLKLIDEKAGWRVDSFL
jgi:hypothetical protein